MVPAASRLERVRRLMSERSVEVLLLSVGSDLPYFTGYRAMPLERLTMLVVPLEGTATLLVPELEAPRVQPRPEAFDLIPWRETDDPVAMVARLMTSVRRAAIGDTTWSVFLLGLQDACPHARFQSAAPLTRELRMRKEPDEISSLRQAAQATDRVIRRLDGIPFKGRTERDLAAQIGEMTLEEGHDATTFTIVAGGPNGASPHHEPGPRVISRGDAVVVDFGGRYGGYCSDTTRSFSVGEPTGEVAEAFSVLHDAQQAAVAAVRPGVAAEEIDRAARDVITEGGFGQYFIHRTGHGIGMDEHEHPYIIEGNRMLLEEGMVFSIEPGIYVPGRFGLRIEDIVAVISDGVDPLNRSCHDLHRVA